ncbi:hypothetical protein [Methanobacterium formicicum]|nr:hypothetical protein [Methanobacterium formicicum]MDH2659700.1 hypothetical protein [Methanobacterium formicicum]
MIEENLFEPDIEINGSNNEKIDVSDYIDEGISKSKVFFWEKWALSPDNNDDDSFLFYEVKEDLHIREVIRNLESRIMDKKILFSDIRTKNPSIKRWIEDIRKNYPDPDGNIVEDLINTFRDSLFSSSKTRHKYIVGVLLLKDVVLLVHCAKDPSLAKLKDDVYSVDSILHPKSVLRAAIIKDEGGKTTLSVFEKNRKWSKGHARFWGIEPEDVNWASLSSINLTIDLDSFPYPIQLPIETEQLSRMLQDNQITTRGLIRIGKEEGVITKAQLLRKNMDFPDFYDYYINQTEKLEEHKKKFKELVPVDNQNILDDFVDPHLKFKYGEDLEKIYELTPECNINVHNKEHLRYIICFFSKEYPGIKPSTKLVNMLYESIFFNRHIEICHAGEKTTLDPLRIGTLEIFNVIDVSREITAFSNDFLNIVQDADGKKMRLLLQKQFCDFWRIHLKSNKHLKYLFDFVMESIIIEDLKFEFGTEGILAKETTLEFKSADSIGHKPDKIQKTLISDIKKYVQEGSLTRYCILYGVEDNGDIIPVPKRRLKSDLVASLEERINNTFKNESFVVKLYPIPSKNDLVLAVFLIPFVKV